MIHRAVEVMCLKPFRFLRIVLSIMSFAKECRTWFKTDSLYGILNLEKNATPSEVKRAYYRLSLSHHPDRVPQEEVEDATERFQILGRVYDILSDKERRTVYDETGIVDDECVLGDDKDWYAVWRSIFKPITKKDIETFEAKYKGSEEEKSDLRHFYELYKGDMNKIYECLPLSNVLVDEKRLTDMLNAMIDAGDIQGYPAFTKESKKKKGSRMQKAKREQREAEKVAKESQAQDLQQLILAKQQSRKRDADAFFEHLEAKYASTSSATGGSKKRNKKDVKAGMSKDTNGLDVPVDAVDDGKLQSGTKRTRSRRN